MANELHFPLFHGYVDRWLVSGVTETPVITKPTALHGAENEKLNTAPKDKPGEEQFKAERRAKATAWPAQLDTAPAGWWAARITLPPLPSTGRLTISA